MSIPAIRIEKFSHDARGIARIDGKITFVDGALPGEYVTYQLTRRKKNYDEARVVAILEENPARVIPRCRYYGVCGGCSLQHLAAAVQLEVKQTLVLEVLQRIAGITPHKLLQPLASAVWAYRDKARFSVTVDAVTQQVAFGFKKKYAPDLACSIDACDILNPALAALLSPLRTCLQLLLHPKKITSI